MGKHHSKVPSPNVTLAPDVYDNIWSTFCSDPYVLGNLSNAENNGKELTRLHADFELRARITY